MEIGHWKLVVTAHIIIGMSLLVPFHFSFLFLILFLSATLLFFPTVFLCLLMRTQENYIWLGRRLDSSTFENLDQDIERHLKTSVTLKRWCGATTVRPAPSIFFGDLIHHPPTRTDTPPEKWWLTGTREEHGWLISLFLELHITLCPKFK